jgi:hypothetical protein
MNEHIHLTAISSSQATSRRVFLVPYRRRTVRRAASQMVTVTGMAGTRLAGPCIRAVQIDFALITPRCMIASHLEGRNVWMPGHDGLVPVVTLIPIFIHCSRTLLLAYLDHSCATR